jgi:hypothetical protein
MLDKIVNFCCDFRDDWKVAVDAGPSDKLKDLAKTLQERRVGSLFCRAFGVGIGIASLPLALRAISVVFTSPLTTLISGVAAAIFFALAHDFIEVGYQLRTEPPKLDASSIRAAFRSVGAIGNWIAGTTFNTISLERTWILKHIEVQARNIQQRLNQQ